MYAILELLEQVCGMHFVERSCNVCSFIDGFNGAAPRVLLRKVSLSCSFIL